jgi:hypothetical protein
MSGAELDALRRSLAAQAKVVNDAIDDLVDAQTEAERLREWIRAIAALAGPDAIALAERAIAGELWPAALSDGHGTRRV